MSHANVEKLTKMVYFVEYSAKITFLTEIYKIYLYMSKLLCNFALEWAIVYFASVYIRVKKMIKLARAKGWEIGSK